MSGTTWLEVMPPIRLACGVPVAPTPGNPMSRAVVIWTDGVSWRGLARSSRQDLGIGYSNQNAPWRVDLEDPLGFAHALRWLHAQPGWSKALANHHPAIDPSMYLTSRWLEGQRTNAGDRLALARACAEVRR